MEKALRYFKRRCNDLKACLDTCRDKDALKKVIAHNEKAVEALEKQTQKKILHDPAAGREADWTCPACKQTCNPYARYCQNCGQALHNEQYEKD